MRCQSHITKAYILLGHHVDHDNTVARCSKVKSEKAFSDAWTTVGAQLLSAQFRNTTFLTKHTGAFYDFHPYARDSLGGQHNTHIALLAYLNVCHGGENIV